MCHSCAGSAGRRLVSGHTQGQDTVGGLAVEVASVSQLEVLVF